MSLPYGIDKKDRAFGPLHREADRLADEGSEAGVKVQAAGATDTRDYSGKHGD